jgi:hypothetical protein
MTWPPEVQQRPFSQACENNREPILAALRTEFAGVRRVLEIGSGTGQHACYFSREMPHLQWQPTDLAGALAGIERWRADAGATNLLPARELDVRWQDWQVEVPDGVFNANGLHIMAWEAVKALFAHLKDHAPTPCVMCVYGPFNYGGRYTAPSNARFDQWLAERDPASAIRDFEAVDELATMAGFRLGSDRAMPANNRLLTWRR